ncbi:PREDICTED: C-X-C motif chemokine 16 isoform X2 [Myotis davidii]|uniref:C-X-C motif chemokine 16 isoform X2 n=1 Tax=Myotis davidii TaxID=225400 RepID=UPI00076728BF|nr:PREDICTED: C-X-C motif chemokine 16 isoform X2 [Myotis davidii]
MVFGAENVRRQPSEAGFGLGTEMREGLAYGEGLGKEGRTWDPSVGCGRREQAQEHPFSLDRVAGTPVDLASSGRSAPPVPAAATTFRRHSRPTRPRSLPPSAWARAAQLRLREFPTRGSAGPRPGSRAHASVAPRTSGAAGEGSESLRGTCRTTVTHRSLSGSQPGPRGPEMRSGWGPWSFALRLLLLAQLAVPECGHAYSGRVVQQEHSPPPRTQIPESTEGAPAVTDTPAQTYLPFTLQSTQQPTLPVGTLSLDKKLIHSQETTTSSVGHSVEVGPEAGVNQKHLEENVGPTAGSHDAMVPVLSLLGIILTGALLYVVCKRRSKQSPWYSPDLQRQYRPVASYSFQQLG